MDVKDRVREHRKKLKQQDCRRLEVWLGIPLIEKVREIASCNHESMSSAVQNALEAHVTAHAALRAEQRRLNDERTRLQGQADSVECRRQIAEYNRQLAAFNERVARFQQTQ